MGGEKTTLYIKKKGACYEMLHRAEKYYLEDMGIKLIIILK
jgi:hypothetical protein